MSVLDHGCGKTRTELGLAKKPHAPTMLPSRQPSAGSFCQVVDFFFLVLLFPRNIRKREGLTNIER